MKWVQISKDTAGKDLIEFSAISDDILRLSLLTLVHRAAPKQPGTPTTFSGSCTDAARATLRKHQDCMAIIERSSEYLLPIYVHWYVVFQRSLSITDRTGLFSLPPSSPSLSYSLGSLRQMIRLTWNFSVPLPPPSSQLLPPQMPRRGYTVSSKHFTQ